jgi:hypothetical protein
MSDKKYYSAQSSDYNTASEGDTPRNSIHSDYSTPTYSPIPPPLPYEAAYLNAQRRARASSKSRGPLSSLVAVEVPKTPHVPLFNRIRRKLRKNSARITGFHETFRPRGTSKVARAKKAQEAEYEKRCIEQDERCKRDWRNNAVVIDNFYRYDNPAGILRRKSKKRKSKSKKRRVRRQTCNIRRRKPIPYRKIRSRKTKN